MLDPANTSRADCVTEVNIARQDIRRRLRIASRPNAHPDSMLLHMERALESSETLILAHRRLLQLDIEERNAIGDVVNGLKAKATAEKGRR